MAYVLTNIDKATLVVAKTRLRIFSITFLTSIVLAVAGYSIAGLSDCFVFGNSCHFARPAELSRNAHSISAEATAEQSFFF